MIWHATSGGCSPVCRDSTWRPSMANPNFAEFIRLLDRATERQTIHWEPTDDEDCFQARVGAGSVRLARSTYRGGFLLELIDHPGKVVEQYESSGEEETALARELFQKVR